MYHDSGIFTLFWFFAKLLYVIPKKCGNHFLWFQLLSQHTFLLYLPLKKKKNPCFFWAICFQKSYIPLLNVMFSNLEGPNLVTNNISCWLQRWFALLFSTIYLWTANTSTSFQYQILFHIYTLEARKLKNVFVWNILFLYCPLWFFQISYLSAYQRCFHFT